MRATLQKNKRFQLQGRPGTFQILDVLGCGSSCVAYRAAYEDGHGNRMDCLLKEYNPAYLPMARDETGKLSTPQTEAFQEGQAHFRESSRLQETLCRVPGLRNSTPAPGGLYSGLGTDFTVTPLYDGKSYQETVDTSLLDTLKTLKALTAVIGRYHQAGYLHLDVKPANLFILPETREHVILFDFDSVVELGRIGRGITHKVRYTQAWAAPELVDRCRWKSICPATDLFSIGEILFCRLMGRHSEIWERRSFSQYPQLQIAPLLEAHAEDGRLLSRLTEFFRRTLCSSINGRWQSAAKVQDALTELISLASKEYYLCTTRLACKDVFWGRERELDEICERLSDNPQLFLCGMGGVGKSELAKQYAMLSANSYDAILFAGYADSLQRTLSNGIKIANLRRLEGETQADYCRRKLDMMGELCSPRDLLIIDNLNQDTFEGEEAELWRQLLALNCTLLITSRCGSWEFPRLPVGKLEREEDLQRLFQYWSERKDAPEAVREIIGFFDGHTLAVELAAKQIKASALTPKEYLTRLYAQGLGRGGEELVRKDSQSDRKTAAEHIRALFDMASLNEESRKILRCMALLPREGVERSLFRELCHMKNFTAINMLNDFSWLSLRNERLYIHPLIAEVAMLEEGPAKAYDDFLPSLAKRLYTFGAVPIVEGDDWAEYVGSCAAYTLSKYPKLISRAIAWFFEAVSRLFLNARFYPLAMDYGRLAFKTSAALDDGGETALEMCETMECHWAVVGMFSEELWYWEREEEIRKELGIPEEFYLAKGRFFFDHDEYERAEECFEKERILYGESSVLSSLLEALSKRRP